ncbi:MAG: phosphate transport system regulatory protein PhoU [Acidimicrobiaceae bacterium]|nr:phosphate transport system regulatory protein PhoU [Acidimicrobiaceae bacterium]|tara:strand:+ start:4864 stop:5580 length:717 start_codon:yes stop_codon:yes gene_type:complete
MSENEETRSEFHQLMDEVRSDLVRMGGLVTEGIASVTVALLANDLAMADQISTQDDEIDLLSVEAEEKCIRMLALQQPVAVDLRTILTDLRMVSEIERSGDLVSNIAKGIGRIQGVELEPRLRGLIDRMCEQAVRLTTLAIDSYADKDAALAGALGELDDRLDELHNDYIDTVFSSRFDRYITTQQAVQLAVIGRFYERIGDHAVNIGERVQYLVTGELPEHKGAQRARIRRERSEEV